MIVGVMTVHIHLQGLHSLKDKRRIVKSLIERLKSRFNVSVSEVEAPYQRRNVPIIGDKILFDEVQFTFLVDEDMKSYEEMFAWLNRIVNDDYKTSAGTLLSGIGSEADITVTILSSHNNAKKQIRYVNAFPVNVTGIEFAATNTEISPLTFSAGFRYSYFELL